MQNSQPLSRTKKIEKLLILKEKQRRKAKTHFPTFAKKMFPKLQMSAFHKVYYEILDLYAHGIIRKLMITVPPQHGKSEGSTRLLPPFILGLDPDRKTAIASYSTPRAQKFNRDIQRYLDSEEYIEIFPETRTNTRRAETEGNYLKNANETEIVGHVGGVKGVGRGGALTGDPVDNLVIDDLYKDYEEGNSPTTLESAWNWYTSVADSRLHNDSQQLIVFTRWNEGDLVGRIEEKETVITLESPLDEYDPDLWYKVNFEAIKESDPTELDPREYGAPLWPERHSLKKLERSRSLDSENFNCLYQGNPESKEGYLYKDFRTYKTRPDNLLKDNYTDTADTGDDWLCSICYEYDQMKPEDIYVVDVLFTPERMEVTEPATAMLLARNKTTKAWIESNNGGRGFARNVERELREMKNQSTSVEWFHQGGNKESRIYSNHAQVNARLIFPYDWEQRWPRFYLAVKKYKKLFSANKHDDAPDTMTGIIERLDESGIDVFDAV
jgi:predicted phage terminase large subunit-like protein